MVPRAILLISATIILFLSACSVKTTEALTSESFTREIEGNYTGVLPCASCPGIQTSIKLKENGKYILFRTYLDRDSNTFIEEGTLFKTNKPAVLSLKNKEHEKTYIKLENSHVRILNTKGKEIEGVLSKHYILQKQTLSQLPLNSFQITEKTWQLEYIKGFSEEQLKEYPQLPTMEFDAEGQRVSGFAGCNNYFGNYTLTDQGKVNFSELASTKKMCINSMNLEDAFLQTLDKSEWISVEGRTLNIKDKEEQVLASFVAQ